MPRGGPGWLLDVQADLLQALNTRTVVPLLPIAGNPPPICGLNPVFLIAGVEAVMVTQAIATLPRTEKAAIALLDWEHDQIARALDPLLTGF